VHEVDGATWSLAYYRDLLTDSFYLRQLLESVELGLLVTGLTLLLGFPVAMYMHECSPTRRRLIFLAVLSPLLTSVVVRSFGWMVVLGDAGILNKSLIKLGLIDEPIHLANGYPAVTIGFVHVLLPFMILPILAVLEKLDPTILEAGRSLGASSIQRFRRLLLPLTLPGIGAGGMIVFCLTMGAYATPLILGGGKDNNLALLVYRNSKVLAPNYEFAGAISVVLAACTAALILFYFIRVEAKTWPVS
jgi:putative spermidine/putrescine transport system permease protein